MIPIPIQLQNPDFRFVLLGSWNKWKNVNSGEIKEFNGDNYSELIKNKLWKPLGKQAFEEKWQSENNYHYNDIKTIKHLHNGNIGIVGGYGKLRIQDIDDKTLIPYFKEKFKDTLIIETGTGGIHIYLLSNYDKNHNLINRGGEYRADNRYVVTIPSKHPNGKDYKIINNKPIKGYTPEKILEILNPYMIKKRDDEDDVFKIREKDPSRSGLEYRKIVALLREGKTKEEIAHIMLAYSKWVSAPQQYRDYTYSSALEFVNKEKEKVKELKLDNFITNFTNKLELASKFYNIQPVYYDGSKIWWFWNHKEFKWFRVDETDILNAISSHSYANTIKSSQKNEIIEALRQIGRANKPLTPKQSWIQFRDKIIDIESGEVLKASFRYFITNPIPWELGDSNETPKIDKLFREWVVGKNQGESYITTLYEIVSYCLLSYIPIHRIFCLIGEGLNGKGSFLRLIEKFVGKENVTSSNLDTLTKSNFESSKLYRKLVCLIGEVDKSIFTKTALLKSITGDDLIRVEFKGKDCFDTHLYAKPITACNILPETSDKTKGFFRRWTIVDFPNIFDEKRDVIKTIPDEEFHNLAFKSINILKNVIKNGEFTNDGSIENRERRYEERSNPLDSFIKEYCIRDSFGKISTSEFYERFVDFLKSQNYRIHSKSELAKSMSMRGFERKTIRVSKDFGEGFTTDLCFLGLKWIENFQKI